MKAIIKTAVLGLLCCIAMTGCEVFGLEFQQPYKYDYEAGMPSNKIEMTTYEFIQSRPDIFSLLLEAIDYAGMKSDFEQQHMTYLLPTNKALSSDTSSDLSYFQTHGVEYFDEELGEMATYAPTSMTFYPKQQVIDFLQYHIVKGEYTHTNFPAEPTWFETCAPADTAYVNIYILKDRNPNTTFNNFDGHYKSTIKPRTGNLYATGNSSYMHVLDSWLDRPTQKQINK